MRPLSIEDSDGGVISSAGVSGPCMIVGGGGGND